MQSEQYTPPQSEQTPWYGQETYVPDRQADADESSLEVLRARRATAEAFASIPSGVAEVIPVSVEKLHQGKLHEVQVIGARLARFRQAYQENNFDLSDDGDSEVSTSMFAQSVSRDEDTIDLLKEDELDSDMFMPSESNTHASAQDMFDKAA